MYRVSLLAFMLFISTPVLAQETPQFILKTIPSAQKVGEGRLTYLFKDIYDAKLYAPSGNFTGAPPFAIKIDYKVSITGEKIANISIDEMRKQGYKNELMLATWFNEMKKIFPDVEDGISITGIYINATETLFFQNNKFLGKITDPEFGKQFFGIWLNEQTSQPKLRQALLGR